MKRLVTASLTLIAMSAFASLAAAEEVAPIRLASVNSAGEKGSGDSLHPHMSSDGRYVVFESRAANLAVGGGGSKPDVFLRDQQNQTTILVSSSPTGGPGNGHSFQPRISPDGRFVVFASKANNLISADTNRFCDIFIREITDSGLGPTERISVNSSEQESNGHSSFSYVSNDGHYVAFDSEASNLTGLDGNGFSDVFVRDRFAETTQLISANRFHTAAGNNSSLQPQISSNGNVVVFTGKADDLVSGDINGGSDVFAWERTDDSIQRLSVDSTGDGAANGSSSSPSISSDGNVVAFMSDATNISAEDLNGNLPDIFVHERGSSTSELISPGVAAPTSLDSSIQPTVSGDGKVISFTSSAMILPGIYTGFFNFYAHDRVSKETVLAAQKFDGGLPTADVNGLANEEAGPGISTDGRLLSFTTGATEMTGTGFDLSGDQDVFVSQIHFVADDAPVDPPPTADTTAATGEANTASEISTTPTTASISSTANIAKFKLTARLNRYVRYTNSRAIRRPLIALRANHAFGIKASAYLSAKTKRKGKTRWVKVARLTKSATASNGRLDVRLALTKKGKSIFASLKKGKSLTVRIMDLSATSAANGETTKITKKTSTMRRTINKSSKK